MGVGSWELVARNGSSLFQVGKSYDRREKSGTQELRKKEIERIFYPRERTKAHRRLMV